MKNGMDVLKSEVLEDGITFTIGELRFKVPKGEYLGLIDRGIMEERFRLSEKPNAQFAELDTVANYARLSRLLKKGLMIDEASRVMGVDAAVLRKFWDYALHVYRDKGGNHQDAQAEIERQTREEGDFCKTDGRLFAMGGTPEPGNPFDPGLPIPEIFVDAAEVRRAMARLGDEGLVAQAMRLELKDFQVWLQKNAAVMAAIR